MKFSPLKSLLFCVVFLALHISINAQSNCTLPGPSNLQVVATTTNSAEIAWTEVPGAADYKIETVDVLTATTVSTLYTIDNTIIVPGLSPSRAYDITVTSKCDNGFEGSFSIIRIHTGIVVVDIILQRCVPGTETYTSPNFTYPQNSSVAFPINFNQTLVFDGVSHSPSNNGSFLMVFETNIRNNALPELLMSTTPDYDTRIRLTSNTNGNGLPSMIEYRTDSNSPDWDTLGYVIVSFSSNSFIEVMWQKEVDIIHSYCNGEGPGKGNKEDEENSSDLEVSPNPTNGWFVMMTPNEATPVLITDMYGQPWYENELYPGEPHEVDATDWSNGTYIIHTIEEGEPVQVLLVKTE